jgi:hypothetical protein
MRGMMADVAYRPVAPRPSFLTPPNDISRIVPALKEQADAINEMLDSMERRDASLDQIKEQLRWLERKLHKIRQRIRSPN